MLNNYRHKKNNIINTFKTELYYINTSFFIWLKYKFCH